MSSNYKIKKITKCVYLFEIQRKKCYLLTHCPNVAKGWVWVGPTRGLHTDGGTQPLEPSAAAPRSAWREVGVSRQNQGLKTRSDV